ncbi:uncharacterized protein DUF3408 [Chryseobacterium sp. 52]|uniref:DUF3408 domain-containing protein n=1 Tax=Chryseobacterium sp. 52 TaxID=2035213 RepID=UPI000C17F261|nr:DUF3408 domain-containing protein [Chryseobacterium sp. 52]PIF45315.1 uncharacterized protein DUF3408 [Chryseobacterium sp. 52]
MEDQDINKQNPQLDEEFIMSIMAEDTRNPGSNEAPKGKTDVNPVIRDKPRIKKTIEAGYGERFLSNHTMTRRGDKSIYIRQEYHERLSRIVQVIGGDKIPLYAYLDNILDHHFDLFEKAITEDFNEKNKPLF